MMFIGGNKLSFKSYFSIYVRKNVISHKNPWLTTANLRYESDVKANLK